MSDVLLTDGDRKTAAQTLAKLTDGIFPSPDDEESWQQLARDVREMAVCLAGKEHGVSIVLEALKEARSSGLDMRYHVRSAASHAGRMMPPDPDDVEEELRLIRKSQGRERE